MNGNVIKSFLVGLGFAVDDASLSKFNKAIANATLKVAALYASIKVAAAGIVLGISKISEGFEQMGYEYRIIAPAINKALVLRRELLKAYSAAGINITRVVQQAVKMNFSLDKTKFAFEAIYKSVASKFFPLITKQSDIFRDKLYKNMPKIQAGLEKFVNFVFKAFEGVTQLGMRLFSVLSRVYDFFVQLHKATDGWSTIILGVIAAWKLLNLSFLATPLGALLAGLTAILALWDDFKVWQEGGKSLFNWTNAVPTIDAVTAALTSLRDVVDSVFTIMFNFGALVIKVFKGDFSGALDNLKEMFSGYADMIQRIVDLWSKIGNVGGAVAEGIMKIFGSSPQNVASNLQNNPTAQPLGNPLGSSVQNSQTNQNVNQQTSIIVQGSADANSTGKSVAAEQGRVNFDLSRNLVGATR